LLIYRFHELHRHLHLDLHIYHHRPNSQRCRVCWCRGTWVDITQATIR
jgi:hypothetical protein